MFIKILRQITQNTLILNAAKDDKSFPCHPRLVRGSGCPHGGGHDSAFWSLAMTILLLAATPAHAQTVGGACTTGVTAGPDANANNLKCVGGVWTANVYADSSGNVGVGTTSPTVKLEVNGNAIVATPTASTHATTKAYVDAAVAAAGGSTYTKPTQWSITATSVPGTHHGDCSSLGAGWRMGTTKDLYYFHQDGVFPIPNAISWVTALPDAENLGYNPAGKPFVYSGNPDFVLAPSSAGNCYGWAQASGNGHIIDNAWSVVQIGTCTSSYRLWCVK